MQLKDLFDKPHVVVKIGGQAIKVGPNAEGSVLSTEGGELAKKSLAEAIAEGYSPYQSGSFSYEHRISKSSFQIASDNGWPIVGETTSSDADTRAFGIPVAEPGAPIPIPIPGIEQQLIMEFGVGVILGGTGTGKTTLTRGYIIPELEKRGIEVRYHTFVEEVTSPEVGISDETELLHNIAQFLLEDDRRVMVVDSLRHFIFKGGSGGTGKGGTNMALFSSLTQLDMLAGHFGKVILFTLNPLASEEEVLSMILDSTNSSVKTVITLDKVGTEGGLRGGSIQLRRGAKRHTYPFNRPDISNIRMKKGNEFTGPVQGLDISSSTLDKNANSGATTASNLLKSLGDY